MDSYNIDSSYPIDRLTAVLGMTSGLCVPVPGGYYSAISIPDEMLRDVDVQVLSDFMNSEYYGEYGLVILLKGNNRKPIVFESENDAIISANQQTPNLGKQLMFSIFRKTGVKFSIGAQVVQSNEV